AKPRGRARRGSQLTTLRSGTPRQDQGPVTRTTAWLRPARFPQSAESGPSRPVFGDDFVQIFGCELTAAVGCQTLVSLLDPKGIDPRIGPVEAVQKILHQRNALRRRPLAGLLAKGLGPLTHDR